MTAQVQVPTLDNIRVWLAADASPTLTLDPYAGGNPNTVAIKTRASIVPQVCHPIPSAARWNPSALLLWHKSFPSWRPMVPREHALPSPSTVKWPSPSPPRGNPPCRLFRLPHLHVMSPSLRSPTSFSATNSQPCWALSHPLMISSCWLCTSPPT